MRRARAAQRPECDARRRGRAACARSVSRFSSSMHQLKVLFALTAASALVACGGGGGDSPAPPAPTPTPTPRTDARADAGRQQRHAADQRARRELRSDARRLNAFNQLNAVRQGAGAGLLAQSTALDTSAQDHANYLTVNGFNTADSAHDETAGLPDFTGANPFTRMQADGLRLLVRHRGDRRHRLVVGHAAIASATCSTPSTTPSRCSAASPTSASASARAAPRACARSTWARR